MMNYGCEGLNVVISGGTSGIGLATAEKFLRDGANVYILGRSVLRGALAVQKLLAKTERTAVYIPCDVTSVEECRKAMASIGGAIHILVNAAGVYVEQRLENVTEADIANIFDTNVKGTMLLTQASLPFMYGVEAALGSVVPNLIQAAAAIIGAIPLTYVKLFDRIRV